MRDPRRERDAPFSMCARVPARFPYKNVNISPQPPSPPPLAPLTDCEKNSRRKNMETGNITPIKIISRCRELSRARYTTHTHTRTHPSNFLFIPPNLTVNLCVLRGDRRRRRIRGLNAFAARCTRACTRARTHARPRRGSRGYTHARGQRIAWATISVKASPFR